MIFDPDYNTEYKFILDDKSEIVLTFKKENEVYGEIYSGCNSFVSFDNAKHYILHCPDEGDDCFIEYIDNRCEKKMFNICEIYLLDKLVYIN